MTKLSGLLAIALFADATLVAAQQPGSTMLISIAPSVGKVPADYLKSCTSNDTDWSASVAVDVAVRRSGYRFTGRVGRVYEATLLSASACQDLVPIPDGTHTTTEYAYERGAYTFTEALVGREFRAGLDWHAAAGGGYSWLPHAPHGVGVLGFRWGEVVRFGVDAELRLQRVTHNRDTSRFEGGQPVELLSRSMITNWYTTAGLRAGVGIGFGF